MGKHHQATKLKIRSTMRSASHKFLQTKATTLYRIASRSKIKLTTLQFSTELLHARFSQRRTSKTIIPAATQITKKRLTLRQPKVTKTRLLIRNKLTTDWLCWSHQTNTRTIQTARTWCSPSETFLRPATSQATLQKTWTIPTLCMKTTNGEAQLRRHTLKLQRNLRCPVARKRRRLLSCNQLKSS